MRRWLALIIAVVAVAVLPPIGNGAVSSAPTAPAQIRPGAVIVRLAEPASPQQVRRLLPADIAVEAQLGPALYSLRVPSGGELETIVRLRLLPHVRYAQPDHRISAQETPNDPRYAEQWSLERIGMTQAWSVVTDTAGLVVAVLDTGITLTHPDLHEQLWTNAGEVAGNGLDDDRNGYVDDLHGRHFYHIYSGGQAIPRQDNHLEDPNGHGTHVAGIIGARGNNATGISGVAWRVPLMIVRVLDQDAFGWESDVILGLDYAVSNGARVVNLSLGQSEHSPALAEAVAEAERNGVLVVAAAGNTGNQILYPAAYPTVLSVGASDQSNARAGFSAYGSRLDLLAPGVDILSTWNGLPYWSRSGTSMAAPHATGVAVLLWSRLPDASPAVIRQCLRASAVDLGAPGWDVQTGTGLLNAHSVAGECPSFIYVPLLMGG